MTDCGSPLSWSLLGLKRTCPFALHMSAYDPKQTLLLAPHMSTFGGKADMTFAVRMSANDPKRNRKYLHDGILARFYTSYPTGLKRASSASNPFPGTKFSSSRMPSGSSNRTE
jgi:hypothetical protein